MLWRSFESIERRLNYRTGNFFLFGVRTGKKEFEIVVFILTSIAAVIQSKFMLNKHCPFKPFLFPKCSFGNTVLL